MAPFLLKNLPRSLGKCAHKLCCFYNVSEERKDLVLNYDAPAVFSYHVVEVVLDNVAEKISEDFEGLLAFEVPKSNRAQIEYNVISSQIKSLLSFGEKVSKTQDNYKTGKKIIEGCMRILSLSKNQSFIDNNLLEIQKDTAKLLKRANREAAFRLKHGALVSIDNMSDSNIAVGIAENSFRTAQILFDKRKYNESIDFLDSALKISDTLSLSTELKNIGLFALSAGDNLVNDGKIIVATPDIGSFWYKIMNSAWPSFKIPEHVAFYSKRTLSFLLRKAGFRKINQISFLHAFSLGLISSKVGIKISGKTL